MLVQVVDDCDVNLLIVAAMVRKMGHAADVHSDPLAALDACRSSAPDLIIVDFVMPEMDGIQYIQAVRRTESTNPVPIVMVTASHDPTVEGRAMNAGATAFLTKPIRFPELRTVIGTLLPDSDHDGGA